MKSTFNLSIVCLLLFTGGYVQAQNKISGFSKPKTAVKQYEKAEWDITVAAAFSNPYLQEDIALDMYLVSPSGKSLILPCYYEKGSGKGSSQWKARFLPQESGKYAYQFKLKKSGHMAAASKKEVFNAVATAGKGILHKNDDWTFKFDNGHLFRGLGENLCWESRDQDDSKFFKELHERKKYNYEFMVPALKNNGGDYFRTWICSWNLPLDWKGGFNNSRYTSSDAYFNPSAIQKLDRLVALSDSLGTFMMLTLGEGSHDEKNGRYPVSNADFFSSQQAKAQYKNRLRFLVARWGYSPAIGAWEFFNEIDNIQFRNNDQPISASDIVQWHDEMSTYLKELDPYGHLVTTSISHRDLKGLNSLKNIDFNQKHIYKNNKALPTTIVQYVNEFKKPYVIGEYGYEYDWQKNFNLFAAEMDSDYKRGLWYGLFSPTPILPLSWWWEFFDDRGTDAYLKNVRTVLDQMMAAGQGSFIKTTAVASLPEIEVFSVKCGTQNFVYLYNPSDKMQQPVVTIPAVSLLKKEISVYDCESGKYSKLEVNPNAGKLELKGFDLHAGKDLILIF